MVWKKEPRGGPTVQEEAPPRQIPSGQEHFSIGLSLLIALSQGPLLCLSQFCIDPLYKAQAKRNAWSSGEEGYTPPYLDLTLDSGPSGALVTVGGADLGPVPL